MDKEINQTRKLYMPQLGLINITRNLDLIAYLVVS